MPTYRLFKLDIAGKFTSSEELEAADDDQAISAVRALQHPYICEVWLARRLIGRVASG